MPNGIRRTEAPRILDVERFLFCNKLKTLYNVIKQHKRHKMINELDKSIHKETYFEICSKAFMYSGGSKLLPSQYVDLEQTKIYLQSIDEVLDVNNSTDLQRALKDIVKNYKYRSDRGSFGVYALDLALGQIDFEVVCQILCEQHRYTEYSNAEKTFQDMLDG